MHATEVPSEWPSIWRSLFSARRNALDLFADEAYDKLRIDRSFLGRRFVILSDPQAIEHVCGRANSSYRLSGLQLRMLSPALGDGLTVASGRHWAVQRKLANRLMPRQHGDERSRSLRDRIDETLDGLVATGLPPSASHLDDRLIQLSIDLIAQSVFDYDRRVASEAVVSAVTRHRDAEIPDLFDSLGVSPRIPSPRMRRSRRIAHSLDAEVQFAIRDSQANPRRRDDGAARTAFSRDFVVSLMTGFESVTTTTLWLLLICAFDPGLQQRLRAEGAADETLPLIPTRMAPPSLLDTCIAETLRLYPPLPLMFRVALRDDETPAGLVRAGALVCMSPWLVQRHRLLWDRPNEFDATRHAGPHRPSAAFIPFGTGARRCVGMHVGNYLVKTIVARILQRFDVSTSDTRMPRPRAVVSLRPELTFSLSFAERDRAGGDAFDATACRVAERVDQRAPQEACQRQ